MDEEVTIIDSKTRNEKIKNFLLKNAKLISFFIIALLLVIIGFYTYLIFQDQKRESISNKYNSAVIEYNENEKLKTISELKEVVNSNNEKQKSKEFFNQILLTENANQDLVKEAQKRLNRDLGE